jgi:hypothetical protein
MPSLLRRVAAVSLVALSFAVLGGCAADTSAAAPADENEADFAQEIKSRTDAQVKAELEALTVGTNFTSESDYPFTFVSAPLAGEQSMTQALVRTKLGSFVDADPNTDKPLAKLYAMTGTFSEWKKQFVGCTPDQSPSPEDCATTTKLNDGLARNLRGIKVFYFGRSGRAGHVDGVGVSVIIVGRTPAGNLAGVRTIAIWT